MKSKSKRAFYVSGGIVLVLLFVVYVKFVCPPLQSDLIEKARRNGGDISIRQLMIRNNQILSPEDLADVDGIHFKDTLISFRDITTLSTFLNLEKVTFDNCGITDDHLKRISQCKSIQWLAFYNNSLSTEAGKYLKDMPNLTVLHLQQRNLSAKILRSFSEVDLEYLYIKDSPVDTNDLKQMLPKNSLVHLMLEKIEINDDLAEFVNECPNLSMISTFTSNLSGRFLEEISTPEKIEGLILYESKIKDDDLQIIINKYKNLTDLDLTGCVDITNRSVNLIIELSQNGLSLVIQDTGISEECKKRIWQIIWKKVLNDTRQ